MKNKNGLGVALICLAAVLWSTNSVLVKNLELPGILISGMRALLAGVVLAPFIRPKKLKWGPKMLLVTAGFILNSVGVVVSIKLTSAAIAVGMQFTSPIWIYVYSRLKGYPFVKRRVIPLAVLMAGVIISMFSKADGVTMLGNIIALGTGICFAVVTQLSGEVGGENPIGLVAVNNIVMAAIILPIFCRDSIPELFTMDTVGWITMLALGIVQFGGGYVFYNLGLKYTTSAKASMLSPLEMVLSPIWVAIFIGEVPDIVGLIGFIVITAGIALEIIYTAQYAKQARLAEQSVDSADTDAL